MPTTLNSNTIILLLERQIDGEVFLDLSREDIASIFPQPEKFALGMKLYKVVQRARAARLPDIDSSSTQEVLMGLEAAEDHSFSSQLTNCSRDSAHSPVSRTPSLFSNASSIHCSSRSLPIRKRYPESTNVAPPTKK